MSEKIKIIRPPTPADLERLKEIQRAHDHFGPDVDVSKLTPEEAYKAGQEWADNWMKKRPHPKRKGG